MSSVSLPSLLFNICASSILTIVTLHDRIQFYNSYPYRKDWVLNNILVEILQTYAKKSK